MPKISTILIVLTMVGLIYSQIRRGINEKKMAGQPPMPLSLGPYRVPWWERVLQVVLVFGVAAYALWTLGIKKFIAEEVSHGGDMRPLIITLIASVLTIAGLYFYYIYANRKQLRAAESKRSPKERYLGYLKIVLIWAVVIAIGLLIS